MLPSLLLIDHDFSRQRDTRWWTAVYLCLNGLLDHIWWELLDSLHDNGHPDHVQGIDVDAVDLSLYLYTATGLCFELISVSRHCVDASDAKSERLPSRAK
jgi:hypothetical protein